MVMNRKKARDVSLISALLKEVRDLRERQEYQQILAKCDNGLRKFPGNVNILYYKALSHDYLDQNEEADICIGKVLAINPDHKDAIILKTSRDFDKDFPGRSSKLSDELLNKIQQYVDVISANNELLSSLQEMSNKLEGNYQLSNAVVNYQQIFQSEIAKQEKDPDYVLNHQAIKSARDDLVLNDSKLEELKALEKQAKELKDKFPEEFTKFSKLFKLLARIENNQEFAQQLKQISENLGISSKSLENLYKINNATKPVSNSDTAIEQLSLEELESKLPEYKKATKNSDIKPLGQILAELVIGKDKEDYVTPNFTEEQINEFRKLEEDLEGALSHYSSEYENKPEILQLIKSFGQVKKYYAEQWQDKSLGSIRDWANSKKGNLGKSIDEICETIAIMDRANEYVTGGHRLRDTQILSTLAFLQTEENQGKLCQIRTGEGKTTIVSLLSVIKSLQGEAVDIITSNPVLAEEGVKDKQNFYSVFNLTVTTNNNDTKYMLGPRECYKADILYGCISSFQFDYLRDSFEGLETRAERKFGTVILDEVDSMLIDNGGHIAKLSGPLPGMESLRYVYINIWKELAKVESQIVNDFNETLTKKAKELESRDNLTEADAQLEYSEFYQEQLELIREKLKDSVLSSNPDKTDLIPSHIQEYAKEKLDRWIDNAIYAKYSCHENKQYIIKKKTDQYGNSEDVVVPVDYANTGVTLKNTIWSHGLHQFVQLKHNLHLTSESLTSSFISNLGYIKQYGNKIYGLTGTLGSVPEQELLSEMYNVSYTKMPTFKQKNFIEYPGYIVEDENWDAYMAADALEKCDSGRAVLLICETIADVKKIARNLEMLGVINVTDENSSSSSEIIENAYRLRTFTDENDVKKFNESNESEKGLPPGYIIIATNIAGRGTDLKTNEDLEANGGLHVSVGFLPCNQRVEEQAFGRTSRQGKEGTAQLILRKSDAGDIIYDFEHIKKLRDESEQERIDKIKEEKLNELNFNDALFAKFLKLYVQLKEDNEDDMGFSFVLQDLKEYWAFWLEKKQFKGEHFKGLDSAALEKRVEEEFDLFKNNNTTSSIMSGVITHNPYYSIKQAESYLENDDKIDQALKSLEHAINMSENPEILYSAYMKLFEVAIEKGGQVKERFKEAVAKCFFVRVDKDETYKDKAISCLVKAKEALKKEIEYLSSYFKKESDFAQILIKPEEGEENLLIKHLSSRLTCLHTYLNNIDGLHRQIETEFKGGVSVASRVPDYLKKLDSKKTHEKELKEAITYSEVSELGFIGLDAICALKEVHDVPDKVVHRAQGQIAGGLASLAVGIAFPPALWICGPAAGALISEGICDIVMELISQGDAEFSETEYAKGKAISYGISIATWGIGAIATSMKILSAASKACKGLSEALSKSKFMETICTKAGKSLEKLGKWFDKLHLEQFNKLSQTKQLEHLEKLQKAGKLEELKHLGDVGKLSELQHLKEVGKLKEISRMEHLSVTIKNVASESVQSVVGSVVMEKIVTASLQELLKKLKPLIKEKVTREIAYNSPLKVKLNSVPREEVIKNTQEVLEGEIAEIIYEVAQEIALGVGRHSNNWKAKITSLTLDSVISVANILKYPKTFCKKLLSRLEEESTKAENKDCIENIEEIIEELSEQATEKIYGLILHLIGKHAHTFVIGPIMKKGFEIFDDSKSQLPDSEEGLKTQTDHELLVKAYETLDLKLGATQSEITKAYRMLALKNHPDKGGSTEAMQRINDAYSIVTKETQAQAIARAKSPEGQEWMQKTKQNSPDIKEFKPLDKHDLSNIAEYEKIHIQTHSTDGDTIHEFGKEYSANKTIIMVYEPAQGTNVVGHYRAVGQKPSTPTAKNSCAHDILAKELGKESIDIDVIAACTRHEYYGIDIGSSDTLQTINKKLQQANNEHSLGGVKNIIFAQSLDNPHNVKLNAFYPHGKIPIAMSSAKALDPLIEKLDKLFKSAYKKTTSALELPIGRDGQVKDSCMMGFLKISYTQNGQKKVFKLFSTSGKEAYFSDGLKISIGRRDTVEYCHPENIHNKNIINIINGESSGKFSSTCAAQKLLCAAIEKGYLPVGFKPKSINLEIEMVEKYFKSKYKINDDSGIRYYQSTSHAVDSCKKCKAVLPLLSSDQIDDRNKQKNALEMKPENPVGEGMFEYSVDSFWNKYFKVSMEKILNLRLIQNKVEDVEVLTCSILDKGVFDIRDELVDHINSSDHIKILIPTNIANKHWVGLFIEKKEKSTNIVYIDPENRNIPKHILHELSFILSQCNGLTNVEISQTNVEQQKYNNCGPEVIENFMLLLSDTRFSQESAVIEHSHLLEQNLLHYCSENQLSGCVLDYYEHESGS